MTECTPLKNLVQLFPKKVQAAAGMQNQHLYNFKVREDGLSRGKRGQHYHHIL